MPQKQANKRFTYKPGNRNVKLTKEPKVPLRKGDDKPFEYAPLPKRDLSYIQFHNRPQEIPYTTDEWLLFTGLHDKHPEDGKKPLINRFSSKSKSLMNKERIFKDLLRANIHPAFYTEALSFYVPYRDAMYKIVDITGDLLRMKNTMPSQVQEDDEILVTTKSFIEDIMEAPENDANISEFARRYIPIEDIKEIISRVEAGENFDEILPAYNGGYRRGSNSMVVRQKSSPQRKNGKTTSPEIDYPQYQDDRRLKTSTEIFNDYQIPLKYLKEPISDNSGSKWVFVDVASDYYKSANFDKVPKLTFKWVSPFAHSFAKDKELLRDFDAQLIHKWAKEYNEKAVEEALMTPHRSREKHLTDKKVLRDYLTKVTNDYDGMYQGRAFPHLTCFMGAKCPLTYAGNSYVISGQHIEDPALLFLTPISLNSTGMDRSIEVPLENVIKMAIRQMTKNPENFERKEDGFYYATDNYEDENYKAWKLDPLAQIRASLEPGKDKQKIAGRADAFASQYAN